MRPLPGDAPDHAEVVTVIAASRTFAVLSALAAFVEPVSRESLFWMQLQAGSRTWQQSTTSQRAQILGPILFVAALVHVGVAAASGRTPGWLWLAIPVMTALIGLLLMLCGTAKQKMADPS